MDKTIQTPITAQIRMNFRDVIEAEIKRFQLKQEALDKEGRHLDDLVFTRQLTAEEAEFIWNMNFQPVQDIIHAELNALNDIQL